jgi:[ribosomal protein S5]-alanine N-acetyltransferase
MLNRNFKPFPILRTERLTLRQPGNSDAREIFILRSDDEINKYLDRKKADSIDEARGFIQRVNENSSNNDSVYWAITFSDKNILVGTICLFGFSDEEDKCEIGYELLTAFQRQGIMREALEIVIDYAFNTIGIKKIEACFHRDNQRSIKLLEKFSFLESDVAEEPDPGLLYYHLTRC